MDFLKTLLLYMTVTVATAVQSGPVPENVPVPTVEPTAIVEEATDVPALQVDLPATDTPAPTVTAEPKPTITPNASYSNLKMNDRGEAVRKMQERLIELGYLPEGAADGAFGYQTYGAVRAFQAANGLARDGVAGRATQTRLFEDPEVVAATPAPATDAPATDTPAPETEAPVTNAPETDAPEGEAGTIPEPEAENSEEAETEQPDPNLSMQAVPVPEKPGNDLGLTQMDDALIVLGESGSHLMALRLSDGVMQAFYPRVWRSAEGAVVVSLGDMADSIGSWRLEEKDGVYTLQAAGYVLSLAQAGDAVSCAVDGEAVELEAGDALIGDGDVYVTEAFLRQVFKANTQWDEDEHTLMLDIPNKDAAGQHD